ncbi:hypothetical protein DASC09_050870 [Saccharomycopsis crataegensis]|uniref:Uncharacterized protein n=1 Tax=Saccharomycopsis crataegensis TaxID=43959 RepID=A0AAV5QTN0_9ASCO|nr:hypothetical protein DASC09_050870 [Saccharomycopsis crataegensis]
MSNIDNNSGPPSQGKTTTTPVTNSTSSPNQIPNTIRRNLVPSSANRFSVMSNTSASVRQKSFDSPLFLPGTSTGQFSKDPAQNHHQSAPMILQSADGAQVIGIADQASATGNTSSPSSLYTAFETNSMMRRNSTVKRNPKNPYRKLNSYSIARQNSTLRPRQGHSSTVREISQSNDSTHRSNTLFQKQKKHKYMFFKRNSKRYTKKAAYSSKDELYRKMSYVMRAPSIKYDIVPSNILSFGYNISQDSLYHYYGLPIPVPPLSKDYKVKTKRLQRSATTRQKAKFVFPKFNRKSKKKNSELSREQRKKLIKQQIRKMSNENIVLPKKFQNFIELQNDNVESMGSDPQHQQSNRSQEHVEEIINDNSSAYSVQLITNSKVLSSPSLNHAKPKKMRPVKGMGNRKLFLQLLRLNPELKSQVKCTDWNDKQNLILRTPSLEFETWNNNGLSYGFNKRGSNRVSTHNSMAIKNIIDAGAIMKQDSNDLNNDITSEALIIKPGEEGNNSNAGSSTQKDSPKASVIAGGEKSSTRLPQATLKAPGIIKQNIIAYSKGANKYDSPITYEFPRGNKTKQFNRNPNIRMGMLLREEIESTGSPNFSSTDLVRRSIISTSSNEDEAYYTPPITQESVPRASGDNLDKFAFEGYSCSSNNLTPPVSSTEKVMSTQIPNSYGSDSSAADVHNAKIREQRKAQTSISTMSNTLDNAAVTAALASKRLSTSSELIYRGSLEGASAHREGKKKIDFETSGKENPTGTSSTNPSTANDYRFAEVQYSRKYSPEVDVLPIGFADDFEKSNKRKSKTVSIDDKLNDELANTSISDRQGLLDRANTQKRRQKRMILSGLFSGGKIGLKGGSKRSSLISTKSKRSSVSSVKLPRDKFGVNASGTELVPFASAGLGITSQSSGSSFKKCVVVENSESTANKDTLSESEPTANREVSPGVTNNLISTSAKKSSSQINTNATLSVESQKTDGDSAAHKDFQLRITNISADEYKRYSDIYEQNKDSAINPDYIISDKDEIDLQRELDSFNPMAIQAMIQAKLAGDNGLGLPAPVKSKHDQRRFSNSSLTTISSKEKFYARRNVIDSARMSASEVSAKSVESLTKVGNMDNKNIEEKIKFPTTESKKPNVGELSPPPQRISKVHSISNDSSLPSPSPALYSSEALINYQPISATNIVSDKFLSPSPAVNSSPRNSEAATQSPQKDMPVRLIDTAKPIERVVVPIIANENHDKSTNVERNPSSASHQSVPVSLCSSKYTGSTVAESTSSGRGGSERSNSSSGNSSSVQDNNRQSYEAWGQYMKKIVNQRINYRLQNSLLDNPIAEQRNDSVSGSKWNTNFPSDEIMDASSASLMNPSVFKTRTMSVDSTSSFITANSELDSLIEETIRRSSDHVNMTSSVARINLQKLPINYTSGSESPSNITESTSTISPDFRRTITNNQRNAHASSISEVGSNKSGNRSPAHGSLRHHYQSNLDAQNNLNAISESINYNPQFINANRTHGSSSESDRPHSSKSKRSNDSVSLRSYIGGNEIKLSVSRNVPASPSRVALVNQNYTLGDLSHSSINLTLRRASSPKGSMGSRNGSIRSKSSSGSFLLRA